jgi:hypothetical protein
MICLSQVYHVYVIYMYMFVHVYIQVKDRFCSLLSDQVASLQDQLSQMRLDKTPEPEEPSSSTENSYRPNYAQETGPQDGLYKSEGRPIDQHPQLLELKSQLIKEKEELKGL